MKPGGIRPMKKNGQTDSVYSDTSRNFNFNLNLAKKSG